ncbi:hypothetical protein BVC80_6703g2 [Macleaya cordata]|uniref:Uncharacterized protein n=1 Tax=Macleaya cordata TaxID=56857 RepID=A0A200QFZ8_MACCD|nr:hypothetical protein BVC80_6703g2 [Macleaya cordata]
MDTMIPSEDTTNPDKSVKAPNVSNIKEPAICNWSFLDLSSPATLETKAPDRSKSPTTEIVGRNRTRGRSKLFEKKQLSLDEREPAVTDQQPVAPDANMDDYRNTNPSPVIDQEDELGTMVADTEGKVETTPVVDATLGDNFRAEIEMNLDNIQFPKDTS